MTNTGNATIEDYLTLTVTDCKRLGYFVPNAKATGAIKWTSNGNKVAEIGFGTNLTGIPVAVLSYTYNGKPIDTTITLRFHHSNLNPNASTGYYYFVCPVTGRSCRKLYLVDGQFVSRFALRVPYEKQNESRYQRAGMLAYLSSFHKLDELTAQRYRRITYRGKLTPYGRKLKRLELKHERFDNAIYQAYQQRGI